MAQFMKKKNSDIDITNDNFIKKSKEFISFSNPSLQGSYVKYGRDKSCDLDMKEALYIKNKDDFKNKLTEFANKINKYKKFFKLTRLYFYFNDERINNIIKSLGYLTGTFNIKNCNLNFNIDSSLPENIKNKIYILKNKLEEDKNLKSFLNLYIYLYKLNRPSWKISEFIKGHKIINGKLFNLYECNFTDVYIEIIYDNFRVSNYIEFNETKKYKEKTKYYSTQLYDIINNKEIFYYSVIKKLQVFLKWGFFEKLFRDNAISFYNEIYNFREEIGSEYNKLCTLDNKIDLTQNVEDKSKLKKQYKLLFKKINNNCKKIYDKLSKDYLKYLDSYLRYS